MKTINVKVGKQYLYNGSIVTVIKRILGKEKSKPNMQSGELFIGFKRGRKSFLLDNGITVFSDQLKEIPQIPLKRII